MTLSDIEVSWANLDRVYPADIKGRETRSFLNSLKIPAINPTVDVYICSDTRNQGLRQVLSLLTDVNIIASAGNIVEDKHYNHRPAIVIAHGDTEKEGGCGAVGYAKLVADSKKKDSKFSSLTSRLVPDLVKNANSQLMKIPEEWRAGTLYFDHSKGTIENISDQKHVMNFKCEEMLDMLTDRLYRRFTQKELDSMSKGQNPGIIFMNNKNTKSTTYPIFRVDLQDTMNISGVAYDSLGYAMIHALTEGKDFKNSKDAILAFNINSIPDNLQGFLESTKYVRDYINKGGNLYVTILGNSLKGKATYKLNPKD